MPFRERPTSREPLRSTPISKPDKALVKRGAFGEPVSIAFKTAVAPRGGQTKKGEPTTGLFQAGRLV